MPCLSTLNLIPLDGSLTKEDGQVTTKLEFINNAMAYLFKEIQYELNGTVNDSVRDVRLVCTLKENMRYTEKESILLQNARWFPKKTKNNTAQPKVFVEEES